MIVRGLSNSTLTPILTITRTLTLIDTLTLLFTATLTPPLTLTFDSSKHDTEINSVDVVYLYSGMIHILQYT